MNVIIVLNYNDFKTTREYIEKIKYYSSIDKIIIVDNDSPDGSYEKLLDFANEKTHVIKTDSNRGYAYGNNFGIRYALSTFKDVDSVIISNPDIEISDVTVRKLLTELQKENLFAVTGLVLDKNGKLTRNFAWKSTSYFMNLLSCSYVLQFLFRKIFHYSKFYDLKRLPKQTELSSVDVLPGCFFIADAKKMSNIGLFDEKTFLYFEEDIIFLKAKDAGYRSAIDTSVSLIHLEGQTVKKNIKSFSKKEKIFRNSCMYFLKKYLRKGSVLISLYSIINVLCIPERYLIMKGKHRI